MSRRRVPTTNCRMDDGGQPRNAWSAHSAAALLLSAFLAALAARIVGLGSSPGAQFVLSPERWLVACYLVAPLAVALLSLGGSRRRATGVRQLILAGIAADIPAAAWLIAWFLGSDHSWLPLVVAGAFAVVFLVVPSGRCFNAARAFTRGDASRALHDTRLTASLIGIPAAIVTGLAVPLALTGLQPCDLCFEALFAVIVLAAYAVPALVAALLVASARRWLIVDPDRHRSRTDSF